MAKDSFENFRAGKGNDNCVFHRPGWWALCAGVDERGYALVLQHTPSDREPMVRVGCRYFTLKEARKHYVSAYRNRAPALRATSRRMLALIDIAVATANYKGWLKTAVKFNAAPRKVRR